MGEAELAPLQKSRGNHHSYVLKEAISGMVSCMRKSYLVGCEHTLTLLYYITDLFIVEMLTALSVPKTKIMT